MTRILFAVVLVFALPAAGRAQDASSPRGGDAPQERPATPANPPDGPVTMNGCVAKRVAPQDPLTFRDDSGFKYRITGRRLGQYQGQRVEVVGTSPVPKRFSVRGGLFPSPNVAARAGDLDPAREAIARQPGGTESGTGNADLLPEFRVTRIRVVTGACN